MEKNLMLRVAGTVFLLVAVMHFVRLLLKVEVIVGRFTVPLFYSGIGLTIALLLSYLSFKSAK